ncbi:MAG: pyridoxal-dependent decarboxylase [Defluviitaleaceae bacterium]|nr:pyridoxal-dependent decarboxylase [Defluviitaleaceae bacterium]
MLNFTKKENRRFDFLFEFMVEELNTTMNEFKKSNNERYEMYERAIAEWEIYSTNLEEKEGHHFGYPANLSKRSFLVDFFRMMESFGGLKNNVGDIWDTGDANLSSRETGNNYAMHLKVIEWEIVRLIADNFNLPEQPELIEITKKPEKYEDGYWGYITSGGSEGNFWGIMQGFNKYPTGVLYFCESAHYSISKAAGDKICQIISQTSAEDEAINIEELIKVIRRDWTTLGRPAILVLTYGTTKFGSTDDIAEIKKRLIELKVPHYIHVDAALLGGIPKNQVSAPKIGCYKEWGYDSISVSLHKYIAYPCAKGVLISIKKPRGRFIDYIGMDDNTFLGSRDVPAFSLRQQVIDMLHFSDPNDYINVVNTFSEILNSLNVAFTLSRKDDCIGNIFVFLVDKIKPSYKEICKKWQLSEFGGKDGKLRIHVIVFPYHTHENLQKVAEDIKRIVI